jgi:hypothetical protein
LILFANSILKEAVLSQTLAAKGNQTPT